MTALRATGRLEGWSILTTRAISAVRLGLRGCAVALWAVLAVLWLGVLASGSAMALEAIVVTEDEDRIEITASGELYDNRGDRFQVETVAGRNGVASRMSVGAQVAGSNPSWLVFALTNPTGRRIERWLTADRYAVIGSGAVWPDLDARRIEAVTPSIGFLPEAIKSDRADVYRITLEPGQTITFVAELSSTRYSRIYLWKALAYELKVRERQLFNGVLLGLTGLLAIFLTAIFVANHKAIFPTAALVAWCVLAYLCVEFGFFHKLFNLRPEDNAVYRAAGEASIAASLVIFLYTFLRLGLGHSIIRMLFGVWILAQLALVAVAVIDPRLAATFARLSFFLIGGVGTIATLYLALRGQDRAISLIPTWIMFLVWIFGAAVTLTGRLSGEVAVAALVAGLVLVVLLIGFTVTQFAFRSLQPSFGSSLGEQQLGSLAVDGAGAATWEWADRRNEVRVSPIIEAALGLNGGELSTKVDDFISHINPEDRDRFRLMLWSIQERGGGQIRIDFRLRASNNSYRWFELEAASVETTDRRNIRCVGLLRDITDSKRSQERLLHDAVHCSLTKLPNRELFVDRLSVAVGRAVSDDKIRPTVLFVDIDKFKSVNDSMGLVVGDSLLLTVARRLQRHLDGQDTLARVGGDQFAILLLSEQDPRKLAGLAERIRRSLRSPIKIAGREVVLTGSVGIAIYDGEEETHLDLVKEAEIAMYRAKRAGADRVETFSAEMRGERDDRVTIESDLRLALEKKQIKVLFQPIVYLPTEELAGFEALVRWEHPTRGLLNPDAFIPVAEESDLILQLGSYVLRNSVSSLLKWQKILPRSDAPLFLSVNISSRQLMSPDLIMEVRQIMARSALRTGSLRLEITESLAMSNPEHAVERMEQIRACGAELALDDFGTGFSSLFYLQRFPVNTIKLDRGFVQTCHDSSRAESAIVRSTVALAHELGKSVVAEGVEQPEDAAFLRSIGCEYAQGFYYGEAMTGADALELLQIIRKSERKLQSQGFFRPKPKKAKSKDKGKVEGKRKPDDKAASSANAKRPVPGKAARDGGHVPGGGQVSGVHSGSQTRAGSPVGNGEERAMNGASADRSHKKPPPSPPASGNSKGGKAGVSTAGQAGFGSKAPGAPSGIVPPVPGKGKSGVRGRPPVPSAVPPLPPVPPAQSGKPPLVPPLGAVASRTPAPAPSPSAQQGGRSNGSKQKPRGDEPPGMPKKGSSLGQGAGSGIGAMLDGLPPMIPGTPAVLDGTTDRGSSNDLGGDTGGSSLSEALGSIPPPPPSPPGDGGGDDKPVPGGLDEAEFSSLPPGIAASLARLAGTTGGSGAGSGPQRLSDGGRVPSRQGKFANRGDGSKKK